MGEDDKPVSKEVCGIKYGQVMKTLEGHEEHLSKIDETIISLRTISEQNQTIIGILMKTIGSPQGKGRYWEQPWFKYVILTGCAAFMAIIVLAVGKELIGTYIKALSTISQ